MELKIFGERKREGEMKNRVYLKLEKNYRLGKEYGEEGVDVVVCDENGKNKKNGCLITFFPNGKFERTGIFNPNLDFSLDIEGRIKEDN